MFEKPALQPDPSTPSEQASAATAPPTVLTIAGYDPSAGAGVLADLKTFAAHGVYGMACVTALTVQSSQGVRRVQGVDPGIVTETLDCLAEDVRFSAIKVGMLGNGAVAVAVANWLDRTTGVPVILDPVLKSSSGMDLIDAAGWSLLRSRLLARVDWITPNVDELAALTDAPRPANRTEMEDLGHKLMEMAAHQGNLELKMVITGGDNAETADDLLVSSEICRWYAGEHIQTNSTHGTGCAFSSALAARIALGDDAAFAVQAAKDYVADALQHAYPIGRGVGPLDHSLGSLGRN
ncbi:MAG: bifunctional hydroxymethylpyrimidine kinase/phosphomethylpyrimidine kinase [Acidobacteriaceae bacterium]